MASNPVQIILNSDNFLQAKEPVRGGSNKDFFAGSDEEFVAHREFLSDAVGSAQEVLTKSNKEYEFAVITMRQQAWAKSHRPHKSLFIPARATVVGGTGIGEIVVAVTASSLGEIRDEIEKAEPDTRWKTDKQGKPKASPTRRRSEVGAIKSFKLYGSDMKRRFSASDAVRWLSNKSTGGYYRVNLFLMPPPEESWVDVAADRRSLYQELKDGLLSFGSGMLAYRSKTPADIDPALNIRLGSDIGKPTVIFEHAGTETLSHLSDIDQNVARHQKLLEFLSTNPLVKSIYVPPIIEKSESAGAAADSLVALPEKNDQENYPIVGVVDGGVGGIFDPWIVHSWKILADAHRDTNHGNFIGGLLVAGQQLNGAEISPEFDGCDIVDLAVFPDSSSALFEAYYPGGLEGFLDEIEIAVQEVRNTHGVRIFNLSLNARQMVNQNEYSEFAVRLDKIADENDVLFVISGGNLEPSESRPEFPESPLEALKIVAASRDDALQTPSESIRNVSVAALNPPNLDTVVQDLPTCYSRRGPALKAAVKPDVCHVGGAGTPCPKNGTGLYSVGVNGSLSNDAGTSFAAPLVAKTIAALDAGIEGNTPKETLLALLLHNSNIPAPIAVAEWASVSEHFVGHGRPSGTSEIFEGSDHSATMVFSSQLEQGQQLRFQFNWPPSLTGEGGSCRGRVRLTLVSTPPIDYRYVDELMRVNVSAALQQDQGNGKFRGQLSQRSSAGKQGKPYESEQIRYGRKWNPIKMFDKTFPEGIGKSSTWRLSIDYLAREGDGQYDAVPFTAILTIEDPDNEANVFGEVRQNLQSVGAIIADIRTAARVGTRV